MAATSLPAACGMSPALPLSPSLSTSASLAAETGRFPSGRTSPAMLQRRSHAPTCFRH